MNITPLDITQKQFRRAFRGLDAEEVEAFLSLVAAQRASEEIRDSARKEAEITISDAELQAEKIVQSAHGRFLKVVDDLNELKRQRIQFEAGVKTLVESHLKLLEAFREAPREEAIPFAGGRKRLLSDEG
jgi:cell division initiation protein